MEPERCIECNTVLSHYNPSHTLCFVCQEKRAEVRDFADTDSPYFDVTDMQAILGLRSAEQVRRLHRTEKLPPTIPALKKLLWPKPVVMKWIRSAGKMPLADRKVLDAIKEAHGGLHKDETTGKYILGEQIDIPVITAVKNERGKVKIRLEKISTVIPVHKTG